MYELFTQIQQSFPLVDDTITRNNTNFIVSTSGSNEQLTVPFVNKLYKFSKFIEVIDTKFTELTISPNVLDVQALQNQITTLEQQNQNLSASLSVLETGLEDANDLINLLSNPTVITEKWRTDNTFRKMATDIPLETFNGISLTHEYTTAIKMLFGPELSTVDLQNLQAFWFGINPNLQVPDPAFPPGPNNPPVGTTYNIQQTLQRLSNKNGITNVTDAEILQIQASDIPINYQQAGPLNIPGLAGAVTNWFAEIFVFRQLCKGLVINAQQKLNQNQPLSNFDVLLGPLSLNPSDYQTQVNIVSTIQIPPLQTLPPGISPYTTAQINAGEVINTQLNQAYSKVVDTISGWFKVLNIRATADNVYRFVDELRTYVDVPNAVNIYDDNIRVGESILWNFYSREIGAVDTNLISSIKLKLDNNTAERYTSFEASEKVQFADLNTYTLVSGTGIVLTGAKINAWFKGIDINPTLALAQEWKQYILNYYNNIRSEIYTEIEIGTFL
jgi:hypothetical protein